MAALMVTYTSHVSGGDWSLSDAGWRALEAAGWRVKWFATAKKSSQCLVQWPPELDAEGRWMGALADEASKLFSSEEEGIAEWESLTGLDARDAPDAASDTEAERNNLHRLEDEMKAAHGLKWTEFGYVPKEAGDHVRDRE